VLDLIGQRMRNPAVMLSALFLPHVVYRLPLQLAEYRPNYKAVCMSPCLAAELTQNHASAAYSVRRDVSRYLDSQMLA
jgi:hypothetical protein